MSSMKDIIRLPKDLGVAVKAARKAQGIKALDISRHSGRSRDVLNRLERGEDITVSSLLDILSAMGLVLRLERAGLVAEHRPGAGRRSQAPRAHL